MGRAWIVFGVLLVAGCGGGGGNEPKEGGAVLQTIQISEKEFSLTPTTVNLSKTGTYEFKATNDGQITHALEIEGNGLEEKTEDISPGSAMTLRVTLSKDGSYEIYCPIDGHKDQGMKATIVVGSAAGSGATTTDKDETGQTTTDSRPGY
jgi:plastocyanin